jgi:ADP-heptose:LPS heptosyltransferase
MHMVILRADHLGDMLLTTPLARTLAGGGHQVTVVGPGEWQPVWAHNPHASYQPLDTICPAWPRDWPALGRWLRSRPFTHLLVPYHDRRLLCASWLSRIPVRYCQMGRAWGRVTGHRCLRTGLLKRPRHMGEVWQDAAAALGMPRTSPRPELFLLPAEKEDMRQRVGRRLRGAAPLLLVHPFHRGSSCNLTPAAYADVVRRLLERDCARLVVSGTRENAAAWAHAAAGLPPDRFWNACGELTLRQFFALVAMADGMVVGSTGPLQVASALNVPTASVFCPHPTVGPALWRSLAAHAVELLPAPHACPRCQGRRVRDCGFPSGPTPAAVADAVQALIARHAAQPAAGQTTENAP